MNKTIIAVSGYWSTNIGNSFFQLGAEHVLRRAFPQAQILLGADQPGYYNVRRGNPRNAFIPLEYMPIDYLAILGPFLRPEYENIWEKTIDKLSARGVKIIILSAGMMKYTQDLIEKSLRWLTRVKPYILTTRDEETYRNLADLAEHSFNGIDLAFFAPDFYDPIPLGIQDYVVFNFDKTPEPHVEVLEKSGPKADYVFEFRDKVWNIRFPPMRTLLSRQLKPFSFVEYLFQRQQFYPSKIDDMPIVRTDHRFNPLILGKAYKGPNSFVSDIPWPYLDIYSQASCVFSNRVHTCVAALAYGKPAMLFSKTPRARLLQRVGADEITRKPCVIPLDRLREEKQSLLDFLEQVPL